MTDSRQWPSSIGVRVVAFAALVALAAVMGTDAASAQSVFVSGSAFANIQRIGGFETASPVVLSDNLNDTTVGTGAAVGALLGRHVVVQLELAFPAAIEKDLEPPRFLPPIVLPPFTTERQVTHRTRHVAILGGYRTRERRRVSAALLGGVMFVAERTRTVSVTVPLNPPPFPIVFPPPSDATVRFYRVAPAFGFDLTVAVWSRLSVVPQVRFYRSTGTGQGTIGIWPGASVRWTF